MNIAIVTTWFPVGAGYVSKAFREILSKENNVFIYARGGKCMKNDHVWDDEKVTWAPKHYNGIRTKHLINWAKKNKIDILFFNEQRYWKPLIAAKKSGFCIGAYVDYYTQQTVPAFELYDFLICNTKRHYSVFNWHKNAFYIPWGTDINKFKPSENKELRKLTFIMNLGWGGRYIYDRKGLLLAIKAFYDVKGDCELIIYSQIELSKCTLEWQESILKDNRIKFISGTFDPFPYNMGNIYLYPSRLDGIGLSLPEALSSGLPAITTDAAPMNEFVKAGVNGTLVTVEKYLGRHDGYYWSESICDVGSLTKAMQLYLNNERLYQQQKVASRLIAESELDWTKNSACLNQIFQNCLNKRKVCSQEVISLAERLDRLMAPSLFYRLLSLCRDYGKFSLDVLKK